MEMSASQPSHIIYEKEAAIDIDYSNLEEGLTEVDDMDDVRKVEKTLEKQIGDLQSKITGIQAPNMRAMQKLDEARERVKAERYDLFNKCFEHISNTIDDIYKALTRNQLQLCCPGKKISANVEFVWW